MNTNATYKYVTDNYLNTGTSLSNDKLFLTTPITPTWGVFNRKDFLSGIDGYNTQTVPSFESSTGTICLLSGTITSTPIYTNYKPPELTFNETSDNYIYSSSTESLLSTSTFNVIDSGYINIDYNGQTLTEPPKVIKRRNLKRNLVIHKRSRADLIKDIPENEQTAIETLREEITESEFRKYMKYGFVLVKGQSGKTYQIFRNQSHTKVWKGGKLIEEICVRIKDYSIPPTDNVIAFKTIIETNENEFLKLGNVYKKMDKAA